MVPESMWVYAQYDEHSQTPLASSSSASSKSVRKLNWSQREAKHLSLGSTAGACRCEVSCACCPPPPPPTPHTSPARPPARAPARRRARHRRAERAPRQSPEGGRSLSGRQRDALPHPSWVRNWEEFSYHSLMSDSVVSALVGKLFGGPILHQGGCGKHPHRAQGQ